jgi:hypothetical protein
MIPEPVNKYTIIENVRAFLTPALVRIIRKISMFPATTTSRIRKKTPTSCGYAK